jgi:hypothetical protein
MKKQESLNNCSTIKKHIMSKCNFSIPFSGNVTDIISTAQSAITGAGGNFTGDANSGAFSLSTFVGEIKGTYSIGGSNLNIDISDKPMFLGCSMIEAELKKYLKM